MEQLEGMIFQFHAMSYNQNITQITLVIYAAAYQSPEQLFPSTRHTAHSIPYQVSQYQHPYLWTMPLSDHLPQSDGQEFRSHTHGIFQRNTRLLHHGANQHIHSRQTTS